jgi:CHAT domain-containing protein
MSKFAARRLDAKLVVLSACQTALGGFHAAGVVGIARAFQLAGAPRVVMSQWKVGDEPTEKLMRLFAVELAKHFPSEALRRAMIALRAEDPTPGAWAPFTVFGVPR